MAIPLLPFLTPPPYDLPMVDPKTGMISPSWLNFELNRNRVIFGEWKDVPYDAANFATSNPVITWTVSAVQAQQVTVFQMGTLAIVSIALIGGTISVNVNQLRVTIPTLQVLAPATPLYVSTCIVIDGVAAPELGFFYLLGSVGTKAQLAIQKASAANFLAISPDIQIYGTVIFACQSFVTP